ncbi:PAS domain-containing protein [Halopseudomonas sp.]|jgi:PAS domain S-box-containing protein|uniref:PAS domain-containing protein n=1 Tax=Halopseudomonas sp. TaxID=2901191 RepID=UPI0039E3BB6C
MYGTHSDITEEVTAQLALKASHNELASLINGMPAITYRCLPDAHWTMLYMSGQIKQISGHHADEIIANARTGYAELIHPEDLQQFKEAALSAIQLGNGWCLEYRLRHQDGNYRWVEDRGKQVNDDGLHSLALEGFIVDITREHEARTRMEKHHSALLLLNDIAYKPEETLDAKINNALTKARQYLGMDLAILSQVDGEVYTARWLAGEADAAVCAGQNFGLGQTWCQLLFSGEINELFIPDVLESEFHAHPCHLASTLGAYAGIVIEVEGQVFGTLNFSSSCNRQESFDESEMLLVRLVARWLSDTLANSMHNERLTKLMAQLPGVTYQFRRLADGRTFFPYSSPQIEKIYGLTPEQAQQDASDAFEAIHPDDLEAVVASVEHSADTLGDWHATYRVRAGQDAYRWISGQARPERLSDGSVLWHGYLHDIHEQELARQALQRNEARLRGLFEFAPIGIALNDLETGQFIDLNDALTLPSGYTREEFVELSYWHLTPKEYKPKEEQALLSLQTKGRYGPFEKEYIRKDGSRYPVRLQGMLSQDPDGRPVIWSLVEDITERRRLDKMKDQFIATVSHELRTPLTSINGSLGLLAGGAVGPLPEKAISLVKTAHRNTHRLATLINDLLDMEKLVAGKMQMTLSRQLLAPLIAEAVESMAGYSEQHKVHIQITEDLPAILLNIDGPRLIQALTNLLSNAVKFSPKGESVELSTSLSDGDIQIFIRDHGPGVAPIFHTQLFQRFSQADSSDTRKMPGTGLGLAITREICRQLGGEVDYRDAADGGAVFCISLPVIVD